MLRLVWNVDPVLLHLGPFQLRWYGLLFAAGILAAYRAGIWSFERAGGSREEASRLLGYVVAGTGLGARLDPYPRHPAMLYEAAAYLVIFVAMLSLERHTELRQRPGALAGVVLVLIFGFRFAVEFLKEPQEGFEAALPLDMGQLLSVPAV